MPAGDGRNSGNQASVDPRQDEGNFLHPLRDQNSANPTPPVLVRFYLTEPGLLLKISCTL